MSDIEDYAYSPYDDLDDILYDADPAPELADELADHAIHSPVYQDDDAVKAELQDYFSDWEYYSDDYVDDDPVLLKQNPQVGSPPRRPYKEAGKGKGTQRGKKRKLVETLDIPELDLNDTELLTRCIRGTVWAKPGQHGPPSYRGGQENKVALMKNWKEVFAIKNDGWGRSGDVEEDESWANNMSLADMGLHQVQRQSSFEQGAAQDEPDFEDGGQAEEGDEEEDDGFDAPDEAGAATTNLLKVPASAGQQPKEVVLSDGGGHASDIVDSYKLDSGNAISTVAAEDDGGSRKRRRVKPEHSSLPASRDSVPASLGKSTPNSSVAAPATRVAKEDESGPNGSTTTPANRKRKAAEDPEADDSGASKSTASSRAKRVASRASKDEQNDGSSRTTRTTRSSRKK